MYTYSSLIFNKIEEQKYEKIIKYFNNFSEFKFKIFKKEIKL